MCGYLTEQSENGATHTSSRLEFTIGGTCESATVQLGALEKKVRAAEGKVTKAKESGKKSKVKSAKKALKKAKAKLAKGKDAVVALC